MNQEVVIDTNFALIPVRRNKDVFAELENRGYTPVILPEVTAELLKLSQKGTGASQQARECKATLQLLERKGLKTPPSSRGYADTAILAYCRARGARAATHDNELRKQLRDAGVPLITLGRSGALNIEG
jgi:rRNA-processing protein FCF1